MNSLTLYDRLGGEEVVNLTVDRFYDRISNDESLQPFFEGVDIEGQRKGQKDFLIYAFCGSGGTHSCESLGNMRKQLSDDKSFFTLHGDAILGNLGLTLDELGVAHDLISEAASIVESAYTNVMVY